MAGLRQGFSIGLRRHPRPAQEGTAEAAVVLEAKIRGDILHMQARRFKFSARQFVPYLVHQGTVGNARLAQTPLQSAPMPPELLRPDQAAPLRYRPGVIARPRKNHIRRGLRGRLLRPFTLLACISADGRCQPKSISSAADGRLNLKLSTGYQSNTCPHACNPPLQCSMGEPVTAGCGTDSSRAPFSTASVRPYVMRYVCNAIAPNLLVAASSSC